LQYPCSGRYRCNMALAAAIGIDIISCSTLVRAVIDATDMNKRIEKLENILQYPCSGRYRCNAITESSVYDVELNLQYPCSGRYRCNL